MTTTDRGAAHDAALDIDALRAKYLAERDKRLRADGSAQYVAIDGAFAHFDRDPFTAPDPDRAPRTDHADVVIVGGGFSGLLAGARLRQVGVERIVVIERGGDFGGTWYWNRYPGAQCDIESYIYLPLLEEVGYVPTKKYADAPEILEHSRNIARHFGLYDKAVLSTEVTGMEWDEAARPHIWPGPVASPQRH